MILKANVQEACRSLYASKQRTLLALVGIIIGIGSVIAMISVGMIVEAQALKTFQELGTDVLTIAVGSRDNPSRRVSLRLRDVIALPERTHAIAAVAPYVQGSGEVTYAGKPIKVGDIRGVTEMFARLNKLLIADGRTTSDWDHYQPFCVIGADLARDVRAAGAQQIVGERLKIDKKRYTIIGVIAPMRRNRMRDFEANRVVLLPMATAQRAFPRATIRRMTARMRAGAHHQQATAEVESYFRRLSPGLVIAVRSAEQLIESMQQQMRLFTLLLGAIGSISLIVGGIGVMNVMLVSVTERRREIGIRRALGAKRGDIQFQFLSESLILSLLGGAFGIGLGVAVAYGFCQFGQWEFFISSLSLMLGVGVASAVGIFFGFYPARQAAHLDPITALRGE